MIGGRLPFRAAAHGSPRTGNGRAALLQGRARAAAALGAFMLLAGCARQAADAVSSAPDTPGFLLGIWHGFIFPVAWVISLFVPEVAVYAVPNNGGWYDFGFFIGVVFLGVGANRTKTVTRTIYVDRRGDRGNRGGVIIDQ